MEENRWNEIHVDGESFSILCIKIHETWKVMLTNLVELWTESLSRQQIEARCRKDYPLLLIDGIDIDKTITELMNSVPGCIDRISTNTIFFQNKLDILDGAIFKFHINLSKASPEEFFEHVTMPLCLSVSQLNRKQNILIQQIKKKDEEILEYKASGAELLRKHIETKKYNDEILQLSSPDQDKQSPIKIFQSAIDDNNIFKIQRITAVKDEIIETTKSSNQTTPIIQMNCRKEGKKSSTENLKEKLTEPKKIQTESKNENLVSTIAANKKFNSSLVVKRKELRPKTENSENNQNKRLRKTLKNFIA